MTLVRGNERIYVNQKFLDMYGYGREEVVGKDVGLIIHPDDRKRVQDENDKRQSGKPAPSRFEFRGMRKDGTEIHVETSVVGITYLGQPAVLAYQRDITERRNLEEQLRQSQKMEAIGTLAGGVAHEFNNILTVIMGLGNVIQMSLDSGSQMKPLIDQIVASSEKAADLTQSLLAFGRKQRTLLSPRRVDTIIDSAVKLLKRLLPEDIELKMELDSHDAVALLDATQIEQVLMNLAANGRDAMHKGGKLTVRTEIAELDETFDKAHGFGKPGRYIRLSVSDTGIGMDTHTMARIFDPFFTTKEVGKGTGLGLSTVFGIVKQHDGYISVSSGLLKGTAFDIYLPIVDIAEQVAPGADIGVKRGSETILVVEDDPDVRRMMVMLLSNHGYTALEAADGDVALAVFDGRGEEIALVILDVVMPGKNGGEVFDDIARAHPFAKAIFVSGYAGNIVTGKGLREENPDFPQKPLSAAKLLAKVREVLDNQGIRPK